MLLNQLAAAAVWRGELAGRGVADRRGGRVCEATGARIPPYAALRLAAFRGREPEAVPLIQATLEQAAAGGQGIAVTWAHWTAAILYNGLGRYADALAAARQASEHVPASPRMRALPELVEAAVRTRNSGRPPMPSSRLARPGPRLAAPTGGWGSRRGAGRC